MDVIGLAIMCVIIFLGLKECRQQDFDHEIELKKIEFRIDSLKNVK